MAQDARDDKMVSASDDVRIVGSSHNENHPKRLDRSTIKSSASGTTRSCAPRKLCRHLGFSMLVTI